MLASVLQAASPGAGPALLRTCFFFLASSLRPGRGHDQDQDVSDLGNSASERPKPASPLRDPLDHALLAADGHVYDRASIESFLETHDTSPLTNEPLATKSLTPNDALRSRLRERATLL